MPTAAPPRDKTVEPIAPEEAVARGLGVTFQGLPTDPRELVILHYRLEDERDLWEQTFDDNDATTLEECDAIVREVVQERIQWQIDNPTPPKPPEGFETLETLRADPGLLEQPECIVPGLAWRGMLTLLAAEEKSGKSTLTGHAAAEVSRGGNFLGASPVACGRVVWVGLEEGAGQGVRRFQKMGAAGDIVMLRKTGDPRNLPARLKTLLRGRDQHKPRLVVIDSLTEWSRLLFGQSPEEGSSSEWGRVVRPLVELAHEHNVAIVLIHHTRRSDGRYRGSSEIGAAADVILEMTAVGGEESRTRRVKARGRDVEGLESWTWHMDDSGALQAGKAEIKVPVDFQVLNYVTTNPGCKREQVVATVQGRDSETRKAINDLIEQALVEEQDRPGTGRGRPGKGLFATEAGAERGLK